MKPGRRRVVVERTGQLLFDGAPVFEGSTLDLDTLVRSLIASKRPHLVITPNVDQLLLLEEDPEWADVFAWATLRVIDGTPLLWLSRALGAKAAHKHSGSDLLPHLAELANLHGLRVAITGGQSEVLVEACSRLQDQFPNARFDAVDFPYVTEPGDPATRVVVDALNTVRPDMVFVCLGAPKQEKWVKHWTDELPAAVYFGVGAAIDFVAGVKARAPRLVQFLGLEWLWRFVQEPRRLWHRYFVRGPRFLAVLWNSLRGAASTRPD